MSLPSPQMPPLHARGAAAISIIIGLVVLQLVVVACIVAGARDQNLTTHRIATARAFYASEAGMQMAMRELRLGSDLDGDGQVGTISDDGNPANDPRLDGASLRVTASGSPVVLESRGSSLEANRRQVIQLSGSSSLTYRLLYSEWPLPRPMLQTYAGGSWSGPSVTNNFSGRLYQMRSSGAPFQDEIIVACTSVSDHLQAIVWTGSSWTTSATLNTNQGSTDTRPFDVAHEQVSGRGMLVYGMSGSATLYYRAWNGSGWLGQASTTTPLAGELVNIVLIPRPQTDHIMVLAMDSGGRLGAMLWNGNAFINKTMLESSLSTTSYQCMDAAWESQGGRCHVVWGTASMERTRTATWDGGAWSAATNMPLLGAKGRWVRMVSDQRSNRVLLGVLDEASRIHTALWSGSAWEPFATIENSAPTTSSRCFDMAFTSDGSRALIVYSRSGGQPPGYRIHNGASWSAPTNAPALASTPAIIQCTPDASATRIFVLATLSSGNQLKAFTYNGLGFDAVQHIADDTSGGNPGEVFTIVAPLYQASGTQIASWSEQAPQ